MTVKYKSNDEGDKILNDAILNIAVQESDENSSPVHNVNNNSDLTVDTHINNNADDSDSTQANSELQTPSSATVVDDETEIHFPEAHLERLDDMVNRTRWIVPVLPDGELETLLDASIALAAKGLDDQCEPCQKFYRDGLTQSFTKIMTDDAVSGWKYEIHVSSGLNHSTKIMMKGFFSIFMHSSVVVFFFCRKLFIEIVSNS